MTRKIDKASFRRVLRAARQAAEKEVVDVGALKECPRCGALRKPFHPVFRRFVEFECGTATTTDLPGIWTWRCEAGPMGPTEVGAP